MKGRRGQLVPLGMSLFLTGAATLKAALLAYEPFTNAPGAAIIGSGDGVGFSGPWQVNGSAGVATNTGYGLSYRDGSGNSLVVSGGAGFFQGSTIAATAMQPFRVLLSSRGTNGNDGVTTWISFLAARQGPTGTLSGNPYGRGANAAHDLDAGALQKLAVGNSSGATSNTVGLIPQGSSANLVGSTAPFGGTTNFVVVRIEHRVNANDLAYLFVNPGLTAEPPASAAGAVSSNAFDFSFDRLRIFAGGQASAQQPYAEFVVDEYRVGETYADVAPFVAGTNPPTLGLLITNAQRVPGGIALGGTGGASNGRFYVLACTNLPLPMTNWPVIGTNSFDSSGNFLSTNPTAPGGRWQFFRISTGTLPPPPAPTNALYVGLNGSDSNPGTFELPFLTISKGLSSVGNGGLIYLRGGTYLQPAKLSLSRTASPTNTIRLWAYPGEAAVIDSTGNTSDGISLSGNCYHLKGLTVIHAGHNGINISGNSNTVECCTVYDNGNTGLHITGGSSGTSFPAYNLVLNCDAYHNYDPPIGGNADGFSAKWNLGPGNVFRGCRAWENSDDGWDLWMGTAPVLIDGCWAFRQGTNYWQSPDFNGNGNGFKLGGNYVAAPHRLIRCVAFDNHAHGIDQNNNIAGQTVDQNAAWANGGRNFNLNHGTNTTPHVVRNNLSIAGSSSDSFTSGTLATNNSWQVLSPAANTADVQSLDASVATGPRQPDGSLPAWPFLRPVPGGRLVDKGVNIGEPFSGAAPDLGAFETGL